MELGIGLEANSLINMKAAIHLLIEHTFTEGLVTVCHFSVLEIKQ